MFSFIADFLTYVTSVLFPIFASYKALRTSDPALLTPWLMYWTSLSLCLAAESFCYPVLSWVPFYAWFRFALHLYLVLPGQQGSVFIYQSYIHPFLEEHERQIDRMISEGHNKARQAGLQYAKKGVEWVKVNIMGFPPKQPSPPPSRNVSYTSSLMSRFSMPSARQGPASGVGTGDLFTMLGSALQQQAGAAGGSRDIHAGGLSASGNLIPPNLDHDERMSFISERQQQLRSLLQAFDREADPATQSRPQHPQPPYPLDPSERNSSHLSPRPSYQNRADQGLKKSRSEAEFEDLSYDELEERDNRERKSAPAGAQGWSNWIWGSYGEKDSMTSGKKAQ
ncbi:hypothetical protein LTR66_014365 [Elasticomyces elasticus]|nr:hypothetical protein LTR66_014365 [Elasticomyces elasticus]KAK4993622.1 hypothetical protein LTR50_000232 [Elasticomyces elasticus]